MMPIFLPISSLARPGGLHRPVHRDLVETTSTGRADVSGVLYGALAARQLTGGPRWFLEHLVDADPASNNLSGSGLPVPSNKPYIFNLENVAKYCEPDINTIEHNLVLAQSYERLSDCCSRMGGPRG